MPVKYLKRCQKLVNSGSGCKPRGIRRGAFFMADLGVDMNDDLKREYYNLLCKFTIKVLTNQPKMAHRYKEFVDKVCLEVTGGQNHEVR